MKKLSMVVSLGVVLLLGGCFAGARSPVGNAYFYTGVSGSETITSNTLGSKKGEACATNIMNLVAFGDASISEAAKDAGITKVSHVDYDTTTVLWIFAQSCTVVHGE